VKDKTKTLHLHSVVGYWLRPGTEFTMSCNLSEYCTIPSTWKYRKHNKLSELLSSSKQMYNQ